MDGETKVNETNTRTRIKLSQTAKGLIQWEISAEYDTPEKSVEKMGEAIDKVQALITSKGLRSVEELA